MILNMFRYQSYNKKMELLVGLLLEAVLVGLVQLQGLGDQPNVRGEKARNVGHPVGNGESLLISYEHSCKSKTTVIVLDA